MIFKSFSQRENWEFACPPWNHLLTKIKNRMWYVQLHVIDVVPSRCSSINNNLSTEPFKPVCFTNIDNMCEEFYQYMDQIFEIHVPKRTRHRQKLPPWISSFTSYNMKRLQTQKWLLSEKPTSYRKQEVLKLENQLIESSELHRIEYQEKIMRASITGTIFKHLKSLKKSPSLPKLLI